MKLFHLAGLWLALVLVSSGAQAGAPAAELAAADPATRAELISGWAVTPNAERHAAVSALEEGRLLADPAGTRFFVQQGERYLDAASGQPVPVLPEGTDSVPVNNSVRSALERFHAASALTAPAPQTRLEAVRTLEQAADAAWLPLILERLASEQDTQVRAALQAAAATLQLSAGSAAERVAAIRLLGAEGDPARLPLLLPLQDDPQAPPEVRAAAVDAIGQIESAQFGYNLLGHLFSGVSLGSILLLAALGLAITYGLLGVINMAHGEMLMLGAYTTWLVQNLFRAHWPALFDYYLLAALPAAFVVAALVGMLLERTVIRHLYGRPLETLLATWGISLMLMQAVRVAFGAQNVEVANPGWLSGGLAVSSTLTLPYNRLAIIAFVLAVLLVTWLLLNRTRLGLFVRAVTQNRRMADSVGVATGRVDMLAFGLGSGIAGLGGVALSQIGNVGPDLGQGYIIDSFMVVVLGGVGQLAGTVLGALGLGMLAKVIEPSLGAVLAKILILVFIILFIQKRPQGIFALKGRALD